VDKIKTKEKKMKKNLFSLSLIAIFASCFIANGAMCVSGKEKTNQQELTKKNQKMKSQTQSGGHR
jgi:formate/nitrite transporter FocA (FNT family)